MEILTLPDPESVAIRTGKILTAVCRQAVRERGFFSLALSGGKTPLPLFRHLADPATHYGNLDWAHTKIFWSDERCVPQNHEASNVGLAKRHLFAHLPQRPLLFPMYDQEHFCANKVHDTNSSAYIDKNLAKKISATEDTTILQQEFADKYAAILRTQTATQSAAIPQLDCILLGMGSDGHTASLFPDSPALNEQHKLVLAVPAPKGNRAGGEFNRLTLTLPVINAARFCLILVCGAEKSQILHTVFHPTPSDTPLPVELVHPVCGRLIWILDEASASRLS